ncbi:MAG: nucleoid-associated protein [Bacteroidales bacterium]
MFDFSDSILKALAIHYVGNKARGEEFKPSKGLVGINDDSIAALLSHYFLSPFKSELFHSFTHDSNIELNDIYTYASNIFEDPESLFVNSKNIAQHLYNQSSHPKIKDGELYIAYLEEIVVEGEIVSAIGIFKSENKDTFLKVFPQQEAYAVERHDGININRLDKGCLIFDTEKEEGYKVSIVDATNKSNQSQFWKDDFLHLKTRSNDYYQTTSALDMCKGFVEEVFTEEQEIEKADQIEVLNDSISYFKKNESFVKEKFEDEVLKHPEVIEAFNDYQKDFEEDFDVVIPDEFDINSKAAKTKQAQFNKSSHIKLDTGFDIYVKGKREHMKKEYDEVMDMHCYKLYFNEES